MKNMPGEEITTYRQFVERFREVYFDEIKPLIEMGAYETAGASLGNIVFAIKTQKDIFNWRELPTVHAGLNLLASIDVMHQQLKEGEFDLERDFKSLEAYLNQTRLPTREQVEGER